MIKSTASLYIVGFLLSVQSLFGMFKSSTVPTSFRPFNGFPAHMQKGLHCVSPINPQVKMPSAHQFSTRSIKDALWAHTLMDLATHDCGKTLLSYNTRIRKLFRHQIIAVQERASVDKTITSFQMVQKEFEALSPIYLLNECHDDEQGDCVLSREKNPLYRSLYEVNIMAALHKIAEQQKQHNSPLSYTSFASGDLYQDFMALVKSLVEKPDATMIMHLIDRKFTNYVAALDFIQKSRQISLEKDTYADLLPVMDEFRKYVRKYSDNSADVEQMSDDALERCLKIGCLDKQAMVKQFFAALKNIHPQANLSLHVHSCAKTYLGYLASHQLPHADLVTAADICFVDKQEVGRDYANLCKETLRANPASRNLLLAPLSDKQAGFFTIEKKDDQHDFEVNIKLISSGEEK
jgi:hypothetical protein